MVNIMYAIGLVAALFGCYLTANDTAEQQPKDGRECVENCRVQYPNVTDSPFNACLAHCKDNLPKPVKK